jgi:hypothetical protein
LFLVGCDNPFAPNLDYNHSSATTGIADLKYVDGIFTNLTYAYTFKDTMIYGQMLNQDFTFTYRDYDLGYDVSWGRQDEMRITENMFQNSEQLSLVWNKIISVTVDSTTKDSTQIIRGFNLSVIFNPSDVVRIDGRVNLTLQKDTSSGKWSILKWNDESNF